MRSSTGATAPVQAVTLTGRVFPQTLVVRPEPSGMRGTVTFTVQGLRSSTIVIQRVVSATFQTGQVVDVEVELDSVCLGVECGEGIDCVRGVCMGVAPDAGVPDAARADAGMPLDAPTDAFSIDAFVPGADAFSNDAFVPGADAFSNDAFTPGVDAFRAPDAFVPIDAFSPPDVFTPPDAYAIPDAFVSADAFVPAERGLLINEIDYDQPSTDTTEFVEIVNVSSVNIDLSRFQLLLFNGSSSPAAVYSPSPIALSGSLAPGQRAVVANADVVVVAGALVFRTAAPGVIQNGDPDGVCVWDMLRLECVSSLSYGGGITRATYMGRIFSLVSGTATSARDSATAVRSLCRLPDASSSGNDSADWAACATPTPGAANL
jgi:hypothetical protein